MSYRVDLNKAVEFAFELERVRAKFGPMASAHKGYAVIAEEFDEL